MGATRMYITYMILRVSMGETQGLGNNTFVDQRDHKGSTPGCMIEI
jgi:hypothetical protein